MRYFCVIICSEVTFLAHVLNYCNTSKLLPGQYSNLPDSATSSVVHSHLSTFSILIFIVSPHYICYSTNTPFCVFECSIIKHSSSKLFTFPHLLISKSYISSFHIYNGHSSLLLVPSALYCAWIDLHLVYGFQCFLLINEPARWVWHFHMHALFNIYLILKLLLE